MGKKHQAHRVLIITSLFFIPFLFTSPALAENSNNSQIYGYIIEINENQNYSVQTEIVKLVNRLLHEEIPVYQLYSDLTMASISVISESSTQDNFFPKGSFIIPTTEDEEKNKKITIYTHLFNIQKLIGTYKLKQPLQEIMVSSLREPKLAHYDTDLVTPSYYTLLEKSGFLINNLLNSSEVIKDLKNTNYNVFIWGGGGQNSKEVIKDILSLTGLKTRSIVQNFVYNGGGFIGSCWGAFKAASGYKRPVGYPLELGYTKLLNFLPLQLRLIDRPVYKALPGGGQISVKITDNNHPIAYGLPELIEHCYYWGGPIFSYQVLNKFKDDTIGVIHDVELKSWSWDGMMDYSIWWNTPFLSNNSKMKIANNMIKRSKGEAIWVSGEYGKGKVVAFGDHPEASSIYNIAKNNSSPPRIVYNTIFYMLSSEPYKICINNSYSFSEINVDSQGPYIGYCDKPVIFNATTQGGNAPYTYYWKFEIPYYYYYKNKINETKTGQNTTFIYGNLGCFNISLIVVDEDGSIGYDKTYVEIVYDYE